MPKLAFCNFEPDPHYLKQLALKYDFNGLDWTLKLGDLPMDNGEEEALRNKIKVLSPLEVRFHLALEKIDLGNVKIEKAEQAKKILQKALELVSRLNGEFATIHIGLGRNSTNSLHWDGTVESLSSLVRFAERLGIRLCLENLAWGWTSRPELFEKLIRKTGAGITLDLGHARVSPWIQSHHYSLEDFILPHPEKIVNAHIYHEEGESGHLPPKNLADIEPRLNILKRLACDWWVLELHQESDLLATLQVIREFSARQHI
jgi:sugar phosphate isomerase/epimerase